MVFLMGVLAITVLTKGYFYGFIASIASLFIFNYFFTEPLHSFVISKTQDYIMIAFFLLASLICGTLSSKFQLQTEIAKKNEQTTELLYEISKSFLNLTGTEGIVENGMRYIQKYTGYECGVDLEHEKFGQTNTCFHTENYPEKIEDTDLYILPIKDLSTQIGTISIARGDQSVSYEENILIKTVVYQMALVLDREFIYHERERIKLAMESEHLKSTLLRSISHDIRTPLTGIIGASSLILDNYDNLEEESIKRLASDINEESTRLITSVQNILDMTRISEGHLTVKKEFESVDDLINQAISHIPWFTSRDRLKVEVPEDIILVETDGRLIVQVLINLLDNAYKHSGNDSIILLRVYRGMKCVIFEVEDNGPGIDNKIQNTLFDGFVTMPRNISDSSRGVGLGLTICKAIVEAHGGRITAFNKQEGGAVFRIELPGEEE
ncbi:MAG: integral rane sensor signal transduction histidine kinase, partial [Firmicutes bacterium]|nr:integral rane sensor signal transduction histidine kinase [Bacillota bacterium]